MEYSKRYFTRAKKEQHELEQNIKAERAAMSAEEKAEEHAAVERNLSHMYEIIRKKERTQKRIFNRTRWRRFNELMEKAKKLAKYLELDIDIKTTNKYEGVLKLRTDFFLLNQETFPQARKDLQELISESDQMMVTSSEDGVIQFEFWFSYYSKLFIFQKT